MKELIGKRIRIIKGTHKDEEGTILEVTGYSSYGVVCKIKLDNGVISQWSTDFWVRTDIEKYSKEYYEALVTKIEEFLLNNEVMTYEDYENEKLDLDEAIGV